MQLLDLVQLQGVVVETLVLQLLDLVQLQGGLVETLVQLLDSSSPLRSAMRTATLELEPVQITEMNRPPRPPRVPTTKPRWSCSTMSCTWATQATASPSRRN